MVAIALSDPREERFPGGGLAHLADAESGESRLVALGAADVERRAAARRQQIDRRLRTAGIDRLHLSAAMPYDRELLRFFRERALR